LVKAVLLALIWSKERRQPVDVRMRGLAG